jgi:hypothetical protein
MQFISILFAAKKTLRVSFLYTPRFDTPVRGSLPFKE